jgi:hypothetical protein
VNFPTDQALKLLRHVAGERYPLIPCDIRHALCLQMLFHELHLQKLGGKDRAMCKGLSKAFADALPAEWLLDTDRFIVTLPSDLSAFIAGTMQPKVLRAFTQADGTEGLELNTNTPRGKRSRYCFAANAIVPQSKLADYSLRIDRGTRSDDQSGTSVPPTGDLVGIEILSADLSVIERAMSCGFSSMWMGVIQGRASDKVGWMPSYRCGKSVLLDATTTSRWAEARSSFRLVRSPTQGSSAEEDVARLLTTQRPSDAWRSRVMQERFMTLAEALSELQRKRRIKRKQKQSADSQTSCIVSPPAPTELESVESKLVLPCTPNFLRAVYGPSDLSQCLLGKCTLIDGPSVSGKTCLALQCSMPSTDFMGFFVPRCAFMLSCDKPAADHDLLTNHQVEYAVGLERQSMHDADARHGSELTDAQLRDAIASRINLIDLSVDSPRGINGLTEWFDENILRGNGAQRQTMPRPSLEATGDDTVVIIDSIQSFLTWAGMRCRPSVRPRLIHWIRNYCDQRSLRLILVSDRPLSRLRDDLSHNLRAVCDSWLTLKPKDFPCVDCRVRKLPAYSTPGVRRFAWFKPETSDYRRVFVEAD